jgi:AraC-like DNA-binding protein
MATDGGSGQVQRFQVLTQDEAETEDFIRQLYIGNRTRFHGGQDSARFRATVATTSEIAAGDLRSTVDYSANSDPFDHFLSIAVSGGRVQIDVGRDETIVLAGETAFYPLGVPLHATAIDVDVRTLRLPLDRLAAVAEEIAGIAGADLRFEAITPVSAALGRHWSSLVNLVSDVLLADDSAAASPLLGAELIRTAAVTALHTFPNTALTLSYQPGPGWVAPAAVRRAAAFIDAFADQPLTPDQIAVVAGVTGRALEFGFRAYYGTSPSGYLRRIRLERAHAQLQAAQPGDGTTVQAVARQWGWVSPARFAAAYRQRFGVPPGRTLRS